MNLSRICQWRGWE